jgi:hypothetical protein
MVRLERLELPTLGSEDRCSIQLSYRRSDHQISRREINAADSSITFWGKHDAERACKCAFENQSRDWMTVRPQPAATVSSPQGRTSTWRRRCRTQNRSVLRSMKSFGINTITVNPGFFRTELLTEESTNFAEWTIEDYNERRAKQMGILERLQRSAVRRSRQTCPGIDYDLGSGKAATALHCRCR